MKKIEKERKKKKNNNRNKNKKKSDKTEEDDNSDDDSDEKDPELTNPRFKDETYGLKHSRNQVEFRLKIFEDYLWPKLTDIEKDNCLYIRCITKQCFFINCVWDAPKMSYECYVLNPMAFIFRPWHQSIKLDDFDWGIRNVRTEGMLNDLYAIYCSYLPMNILYLMYIYIIAFHIWSCK